MQKNELLKHEDSIIRVLDLKDDKALIIDCIKRTMPKWTTTAALCNYETITENQILILTSVVLYDVEQMDAESRRIAYEHYTLIAGILPFVGNKRMRCQVIDDIASSQKVSKKTITNYLCLYLVYQDISVLAPKQKTEDVELTTDEKNMRWALNKFFYNKNKNSIPTAYTMMLKEKYCDASGRLKPEYPSIYQFRYFYYKTRNMQTYYISRDGLKDYQRNNRPLLGDGIQEFAPNVGIGMLDATVCDIYLINESGELVGRPILVTCIDACSSLCCGYSLLWEGGMYSLRNLMLNVIADKVAWCKKYGIEINQADWNCSQMPATLVTDMGSEYKSENFEQLSELGITIINLPAYRPELKGSVEKFFDLIQDEYKKHFKGKGVIESDFQERGSHDYRKDACLTMADFEKVILRCIVYYNSQRIIENYPYTEDMLQAKIKPYANTIFEWGMQQAGANMIPLKAEEVVLTLLPRVTGRFTRSGLKVNKMRYHAEGYTESYLKGGSAVVAYNPDDVGKVWLWDGINYIEFSLIETRFKDKSVEEVVNLQNSKKQLMKDVGAENLQAQINLAQHLQVIANNVTGTGDVKLKGIRDTRNKEQNKAHVDLVRGGAYGE